jgi:methyltransferase (TIGR00027 family)
MNPGASDSIEHVSDTALWVATYRAQETERPDALFKDPLAAKLVEGRGRRITAGVPKSWRVDWVLSIRTCIIDEYIKKAVADGVDLVLNLGAGLDTRPYRMDLPASLRWVEVDYPHLIDFKEERLKGDKPRCRLDRYRVDLADGTARGAFFKKIGGECKRALVLTEGVIPYLTNDDVSALAKDLRAEASFKGWIAEYFTEEITKFMNRRAGKKALARAPFRFQPKDWYALMGAAGWKTREMRYTAIEAERLGRPYPIPFIFKLLLPFIPKDRKEKYQKMSGYGWLEPA